MPWRAQVEHDALQHEVPGCRRHRTEKAAEEHTEHVDVHGEEPVARLGVPVSRRKEHGQVHQAHKSQGNRAVTLEYAQVVEQKCPVDEHEREPEPRAWILRLDLTVFHFHPPPSLVFKRVLGIGARHPQIEGAAQPDGPALPYSLSSVARYNWSFLYAPFDASSTTTPTTPSTAPITNSGCTRPWVTPIRAETMNGVAK